MTDAAQFSYTPTPRHTETALTLPQRGRSKFVAGMLGATMTLTSLHASGHETRPAVLDASPAEAFVHPSTRSVGVGALAGAAAVWYLEGASLPNPFGSFPDLSFEFEQEPEEITGTVSQVQYHAADMYVPLVVSAELGVEVHKNEDGLFFGVSVFGVDSGTQIVDWCAVGDTSIAVEGTITAVRDSENENQINVTLNSPRPWRPRVLPESINTDCHGNSGVGGTGLWGTSETRDEATKAALVVMTTMMESEACEAALSEQVRADILTPFIVSHVLGKDNQAFAALHYDPAVDTVQVTYTAAEDDERFVSPEEYTDFYASFDPVADHDVVRPRLREADTIAVLADMAEQYDKISFTRSDGSSVDIDDVVARGSVCPPDANDSIVRYSVAQDGTPKVFVVEGS